MTMVEKSRNKYLYKVLILLIKYIPIIISAFYTVNSFFKLFGMNIPILDDFVGMSLITWLFMYIAALVFQFCIYHRLFLYHILSIDILNIINYYVGASPDTYFIIDYYNIVIGVLLFLFLHNHVKINKKPPSANNRQYRLWQFKFK